MNKNKAIISLVTVTAALLGVATLNGKFSKPIEGKQPAPQLKTTELPKGQGPSNPLDGCIHAYQTVTRKLLQLGDYTVYQTANDPKKTKEYDKSLKEQYGDRYRPELAHGSDGSNHPHQTNHVPFPNVSAAIVRQDPFNGCQAVVKDLEEDLPPQDLTKRQVDSLYQALWLARFEAVESEMNLTPQSWLNNVTHTVGIGHRQLSEYDIKALKFLKMKLPEWYTKEMKPRERRQLLLKLANTKATNGRIPIPEDF